MARNRPRNRAPRTRIALFGTATLLIAAVVSYVWLLRLADTIATQFEARRWDVPAQVYAAPLELYPGRTLGQPDLLAELRRLGYRERAASETSLTAGSFVVRGTRVDVAIRAFDHAGRHEPARGLVLEFEGRRIAALRQPNGEAVTLARLEPLKIGSLFAVHGEDRLILVPDEIPALIGQAVQAVEDRRFEQHRGVDLRAIARAALVNVSHGEIRQGASTLTQQLVRSYFLDNDRTWSRKLREALMAAALEQRYSKDELMHAYLNEVYLGQDGSRAIHGFGLASQFFFGKPLAELELHEAALLIAQLRGPGFYDPRRYPERAFERRDLVIGLMAAQGLISSDTAAQARAEPLGVLPPAGRSASHYAAYFNLVRRQLEREYSREDLTRNGLAVYTVLDPAVQSAAQRALVEGLLELQPGERLQADALDGAIVVTRPHSAEVLALVGGRRAGFEGFNRALDARRQVGSLIKPIVFLAALESDDHTLASVVDDLQIDVPLDDGNIWSPRNFSGETYGPVTLLRAFAESLNLATVRLGLAIGLEQVADLAVRLGLERRPPLYPSLLLGAVELTPLETAQIYNTLANGGFRAPLRAVDAVVDDHGNVLGRYPLEIVQASDPAAIHQLGHAMVEVMQRGTGRSVQARLPAGLRVAGKTGTSDGLRDSWFAGFTNEYSIVTWLGTDDNRTTGFTGATGAGVIWARLLTELGSRPYVSARPAGITEQWIDYRTGLLVAPDCEAAVAVPVPGRAGLVRARGCSGEAQRGFGDRIRQWLQRNND
jgi:penicillin-binding protein 1B